MYNTTRLVQGIGFKGNKYPVWEGDRQTKEYETWKNMLSRCTEELWFRNPSYSGCTPSNNFRHYTFFYEWCQTQVGFGVEGFNLDKDILVKGNKVYSEDFCVFIPQRLNKIIVGNNVNRGDYPLGVSLDKERKKYKAQCKIGNKLSKFIGRYSTVDEAFLAYKTFKEAYIKQEVEQYKHQLDPRAYQALLNYTVEITD